MKNKRISIVIVACVSGLGSHLWVGQVWSAQNTADHEMGLSKTSVFETPTPSNFEYEGSMPGADPVLPRAYPGAPPQIPHLIEMMTPITAKLNYCLACHDQKGEFFKAGPQQPTNIPPSHYTDQRHSPDKVSNKIIGARFVCTQCHVPQADAKPLVKNNF